MLQVACPECGKQFSAPDRLAGKRCKCPGCGNAVGVPSGQAEAESEPEPEDQDEQEEPRATVRSRRRPTQGTARREGRGGRSARARFQRKPGASSEDGPAKPFWKRYAWLGAIPLIIVIAWINVSLDEKNKEDRGKLCLGRAHQELTQGAKDPELVRFLIGEFHEECLQVSKVQEQVTRRTKAWTYDVDQYLSAMRRRIEGELSKSDSELVARYRSKRGGT